MLLALEGAPSMTFLDTRYRLARSLTTEELDRLSSLSTLYGIRALDFKGEDLVIEYDASRIHEAEVLAAVRRTGVPAAAEKPIPLGGFDHTGEFKDYAWPTSGVSPVNEKN
jgi:hypothetical protein